MKTKFADSTDNNDIKPQIYDILVYSETVQTIGTDGTNYATQENGYQEAWKEFLRDDTLFPDSLNSYRDENNHYIELAEGTYTVLNSGSPEPSGNVLSGTVVVDGNVTLNERISVSKDTKLILSDNCNLTIDNGILVSAGKKIEIYGQKNNTGTLTATAKTDGNAGIGSTCHQTTNGTGDIIIYGGTINATGCNGGAGIGGGHNTNGGNITIYGGNITATGGACDGTGAGAGIGGGYSASNAVRLH